MAGGIAPLVALTRGGTDEQKNVANLALWNLAENKAYTAAVARREGGVDHL